MKNSHLFTRLLAALLTLFVFAGITAVPALANGEPEPPTYTITLQKSDSTTGIQNDWTGMTATAYQVFSLASTADTTNKVYEVHDDFKAFFDIDNVRTAFTGTTDTTDTSVYLGYNAEDNKLVAVNTATAGYIEITNDALLDEIYGESDLVSRIGSNSVATFYSWIEQYIEKSTSLTQEPVTAAASSADTFTITVPADGYYALLFSNVPDGISVKQGILVTANSSIVVKAEDIPLTKNVQNQTDSNKADSSTASMGDILTYEITTKVPTLTDYSNLTLFQLSDTMENQQLNADSFSLKIGNSAFSFEKDATSGEGTTSNVYTAKDTNQSLIATLTIGAYTGSADGGSQSFTLVFGQYKSGTDPDAIYDTSILEQYEGQTITLTYTATLTADAVTVNGNDVTLNYTNNGETGKKEAHTDVYTYGIQVTKTFSDNSTTANYAAVKFQLYTEAEYQKDETTRTAMTLYQAADGTYKTTGTTATAELSLDTTKGTLTVLGLKEGTYWLVETATAAGFNKSEDIKITLVAETKPDGDPANLDEKLTEAKFKNSVTEITQTIKNCTDTSGTETVSISQLQFTVLNQKGFTLPQTGGAGTWMFTFGGIALIAAAGVLLAISCKKSKNK